jgi:hypothetical protein
MRLGYAAELFATTHSAGTSQRPPAKSTKNFPLNAARDANCLPQNVDAEFDEDFSERVGVRSFIVVTQVAPSTKSPKSASFMARTECFGFPD